MSNSKLQTPAKIKVFETYWSDEKSRYSEPLEPLEPLALNKDKFYYDGRIIRPDSISYDDLIFCANKKTRVTIEVL